GEQLAARRPVDRRDHRRAAVDGRVLGVDRQCGIGRRVVLRAFVDPLADQRDVALRQGGLFQRHRRVAFVVWRNLFEQVAVVRLAGDDRSGTALTTSKYVFENGKIEFAAGFRRLVTAMAVRLEDREDSRVITDGLWFSSWRAGFWSG